MGLDTLKRALSPVCFILLFAATRLAAPALPCGDAVQALQDQVCRFRAHSGGNRLSDGGVLAGVSNTMSESWRKLWRWFLYSYIGVIVAVLLLFISAALAALLTFAAALAMLVVSIMKLVYLWRTIKCFKSMTK